MEFLYTTEKNNWTKDETKILGKRNKEVEDKIENSRLTGNERKMELH